LKVAVVGAGWAGLAAAVRATQAGHAVCLYDMAGEVGGRARAVDVQGLALDNGQHILIGAYVRTLHLMQTVGADLPTLLHRQPLELRYPDGRGLRLPAGPAWLAFARGVFNSTGWSTHDRLALLRAAAGWLVKGFRCDAQLSVAQLCAGLPSAVRELLIDPLCVAALNTPAHEASARVLLRVLRDALFSGPGSADLMLPRAHLSALLPTPATQWLVAQGATLHLGTRVQLLQRENSGWALHRQSSDLTQGTETFDAVVLACSAAEAARLAAPLAPAWAAQVQALRYEPIVTVYLQCQGARLPAPMVALLEGPDAPAQFAFDHTAYGGPGGEQGVIAFVVSGARAWVDKGLAETGAAVLRQAQRDFATGTWPSTPTLLRVLAEKRATFRCTPSLQRPGAEVNDALTQATTGPVNPGLWAAGDYVAGPYPATLEGAVRSGEWAAAALERPTHSR
jgi:hydroxysqualene dehydroxylase